MTSTDPGGARPGRTVPRGGGSAALPDLQRIRELTDLSARLAEEAGGMIRSGRPDRVTVAATKSSAVDVVTQMDSDVEAFLRARLAEERPEDAVLGEEEGARTGTSGLTWVIDPVDGTVNYLYGIPAYAVSVAVVQGEPHPLSWTVLAGSVHSVPEGVTWSAGRGLGATRAGRPVRANEARPLAGSLVGTGFGYSAERRAAQAGVLTRVLPNVRDIRRLGSAALDLCRVADGSLDLYYEQGLQPWDMAAGVLIAEEAGALVTGLDGEPASERMTIAGPASSVGDLSHILQVSAPDSEE